MQPSYGVIWPVTIISFQPLFLIPTRPRTTAAGLGRLRLGLL
jgi:hypothetical protein